jgi:hypothetical protein
MNTNGGDVPVIELFKLPYLRLVGIDHGNCDSPTKGVREIEKQTRGRKIF